MDRTKGKELIERRARSRQSRSKKDLWWGRTRSPSLLESLYSLVGGNQRWPGLLHYLSSDSGVTMDLQQYEHLVFRPGLVFSFLFSSRSPHIDTRTNQPNETAKLNIYIYTVIRRAIVSVLNIPGGFRLPTISGLRPFRSLEGKKRVQKIQRDFLLSNKKLELGQRWNNRWIIFANVCYYLLFLPGVGRRGWMEIA